MKTLRLIAKLVGISLLILGFGSSCKKDKNESITCTVDLSQYGLGIQTYTISEDDPSTWEVFDEDFDNWNDVKDYINYMDAQYDFVDCN